MIVHTVHFRLRRPVDERSIAELHEALEVFGADAPHAAGPATIRRDLGLRPEGPSVAELQFSIPFAAREDFAAYLADPRHATLLEKALLPFCESWLSVQTEV